MKKVPKIVKKILSVSIAVILCWFVLYMFRVPYELELSLIISLMLYGIKTLIKNKGMSKFIKIILLVSLTILLITLICYITIVTIDMNRMCDLREPVFAKTDNSDSSIVIYKGLGYTIKLKYGYGNVYMPSEINENTEKQIIEGTMQIFNKTVAVII